MDGLEDSRALSGHCRDIIAGTSLQGHYCRDIIADKSSFLGVTIPTAIEVALIAKQTKSYHIKRIAKLHITRLVSPPAADSLNAFSHACIQ